MAGFEIEGKDKGRVGQLPVGPGMDEMKTQWQVQRRGTGAALWSRLQRGDQRGGLARVVAGMQKWPDPEQVLEVEQTGFTC